MKKWKCLNLDEKCPFGYFEARISKKYFQIWNQHSQICQLAKFREIMKISNFGVKNALIGCFWGRISKEYCHIWNQRPHICQIESLTQKMNVGIGSPFSEGPGPLNKVAGSVLGHLSFNIFGWHVFYLEDHQF